MDKKNEQPLVEQIGAGAMILFFVLLYLFWPG